MLRVTLYNFLGNTRAHAAFRMALILSMLLVSLLFTGAAAAGPMPGGVGS